MLSALEFTLVFKYEIIFRNHIIILTLLSCFDICLLVEDGNIWNLYCYILSEMLVDTNVPDVIRLEGAFWPGLSPNPKPNVNVHMQVSVYSMDPISTLA